MTNALSYLMDTESPLGAELLAASLVRAEMVATLVVDGGLVAGEGTGLAEGACTLVAVVGLEPLVNGAIVDEKVGVGHKGAETDIALAALAVLGLGLGGTLWLEEGRSEARRDVS